MLDRESATLFAAALTDRGSKVIPAGFSIQADGATIRIQHAESGSEWGTAVLMSDSLELEDELTVTAFHFLNMLQDAVVDVTHSPWPYQAGRTDPRPPTEIPLPQVEATQGLLKLWFGDAANSVLELDPIAYEDFATPWQDRRPR